MHGPTVPLSTYLLQDSIFIGVNISLDTSFQFRIPIVGAMPLTFFNVQFKLFLAPIRALCIAWVSGGVAPSPRFLCNLICYYQ